MVETVTAMADDTNKSLEQEAAEKGIDIATIDQTANEQFAEPAPPPPAPTEEDPDAPDPDEVDGEVDDEVEPEDMTDDEAQEQVEEAVEKAGLDLDDVVQRYYENGETLSDEDYQALEEANYPRHMVDQFIEGRKAVVELQRQTVFREVGGEASYTDMVSWAGDTLSADEIAAYNEAVNSNNMEEVLLAVKGLKARYDGTRSVAPQRKVTGRTTPAPTVYNSLADLKADMANPRYNTDPVFRGKVEAKLARSSIL